MGILIAMFIMLTIILTCEAIIKHNKTNGAVLEITPSEYSPNMVNIVTHILYKGVEVRNFIEQVHEYEAKYVALDRIRRGKRYYKAYKRRYKS